MNVIRDNLASLLHWACDLSVIGCGCS